MHTTFRFTSANQYPYIHVKLHQSANRFDPDGVFARSYKHKHILKQKSRWVPSLMPSLWKYIYKGTSNLTNTMICVWKHAAKHKQSTALQQAYNLHAQNCSVCTWWRCEYMTKLKDTRVCLSPHCLWERNGPHISWDTQYFLSIVLPDIHLAAGQLCIKPSSHTEAAARAVHTGFG